MMKPYTWSPDQTLEEQKNGAYWERNMMALLLAVSMSKFAYPGTEKPAAGWYKHHGDGFEGWSRIISLYAGEVTFHVPDDFDLGALPEIEPNWNGHTTEQKWLLVMDMCGCEFPF
jgi:hypothetical protein